MRARAVVFTCRTALAPARDPEPRAAAKKNLAPSFVPIAHNGIVIGTDT
jgi:hypothetical protein